MLLAAILNPLLKLDTTALTRALTEYKLELSAYSADLEEENEILMKDIHRKNSPAHIFRTRRPPWASTAKLRWRRTGRKSGLFHSRLPSWAA